MQYTGEIAQIQQAASRTADYAARRAATFEGLAPKAGEHILEVGCGSGLFIKQVAEVACQRRSDFASSGRSDNASVLNA